MDYWWWKTGSVGQEIDPRRWMMGDGSLEMDRRSWMAINLLPFHEHIEVTGSYTLLKTHYYDFMQQSSNRVQICRYMMYCHRNGSGYPMAELQCGIHSRLSLSDPDTYSYNGDMVHNAAL